MQILGNFGLAEQIAAVEMPFKVAPARSGERWIIEKGLQPGDRVIVDGVQKAAPGQPVHPVPFRDSTRTVAQTGGPQ